MNSVSQVFNLAPLSAPLGLSDRRFGPVIDIVSDCPCLPVSHLPCHIYEVLTVVASWAGDFFEVGGVSGCCGVVEDIQGVVGECSWAVSGC